MATIIFDLDHTLFDTESFKRDIFELFKQAGISDAEILATYGRLLEQNNGNYDPLFHAEECGNVPVRDAVLAFMESSLEKYLQRGVTETLSHLKNDGHRLVLLTKGHVHIQEKKVRNAGIFEYFDEIDVQPTLKEEFLKKLQSGDCVYFINDNWKETDRIRKMFPEIEYILFVRPDASRFYNIADIPIPHIDSLAKLPEMII